MSSEKLVEWVEKYKSDLLNSYSHDAWKYFDYEDLKVHLVWNGYKCSKCRSNCAVKNKEGLCVKCLVLKEKIDVLNKMLIQLKGGQEVEKHDN